MFKKIILWILSYSLYVSCYTDMYQRQAVNHVFMRLIPPDNDIAIQLMYPSPDEKNIMVYDQMMDDINVISMNETWVNGTYIPQSNIFSNYDVGVWNDQSSIIITRLNPISPLSNNGGIIVFSPLYNISLIYSVGQNLYMSQGKYDKWYYQDISIDHTKYLGKIPHNCIPFNNAKIHNNSLLILQCGYYEKYSCDNETCNVPGICFVSDDKVECQDISIPNGKYDISFMESSNGMVSILLNPSDLFSNDSCYIIMGSYPKPFRRIKIPCYNISVNPNDLRYSPSPDILYITAAKNTHGYDFINVLYICDWEKQECTTGATIYDSEEPKYCVSCNDTLLCAIAYQRTEITSYRIMKYGDMSRKYDIYVRYVGILDDNGNPNIYQYMPSAGQFNGTYAMFMGTRGSFYSLNYICPPTYEYSVTEYIHNCDLCMPGYVKNFTGWDNCISCPDNQYTTDSLVCLPCNNTLYNVCMGGNANNVSIYSHLPPIDNSIEWKIPFIIMAALLCIMAWIMIHVPIEMGKWSTRGFKVYHYVCNAISVIIGILLIVGIVYGYTHIYHVFTSLPSNSTSTWKYDNKTWTLSYPSVRKCDDIMKDLTIRVNDQSIDYKLSHNNSICFITMTYIDPYPLNTVINITWNTINPYLSWLDIGMYIDNYTLYHNVWGTSKGHIYGPYQATFRNNIDQVNKYDGIIIPHSSIYNYPYSVLTSLDYRILTNDEISPLYTSYIEQNMILQWIHRTDAREFNIISHGVHLYVLLGFIGILALIVRMGITMIFFFSKSCKPTIKPYSDIII